MPKRGLIPTPDEGRRIYKTVRHYERTHVRKKARRRKRRRQTGGIVNPNSGSFPSGTGPCDCSNCIQGIDLTGTSDPPTECCEPPLSWTFACSLTGAERVLKWIGGDRFATDAFLFETDEGCSNEYAWLMNLADGTLSLTVAVDNGCTQACVLYNAVPWVKCNCTNVFELRHSSSVIRSRIDGCKLCVTPNPTEAQPGTFCGGDTEYAGAFVVTIEGVTDDVCTECDSIDGTYVLFERDQNDAHCGGRWSIESARALDCTPQTASDATINCVFLDCPGSAGWTLTFNSSTAAWAAVYRCAAHLFDPEGDSTFTLDETYENFCAWPSTVTVSPISDDPPTGDGSCQGCSPDTAPADAEGSCFKDGECLDITEADCTVIGGTWLTTDAECEALAADYGTSECSCCFCDGGVLTCVDNQTQESCDALQATYTGGPCVGGSENMGCREGVTCAEMECAPEGCCCDCMTDDTLEPRTEAECIAEGGFWAWCGGDTCAEVGSPCSAGCSGCA